MGNLWFLALTLCPVGDSADCHNYVLDGELSYSDCVAAMPKQLPTKAVFIVDGKPVFTDDVKQFEGKTQLEINTLACARGEEDTK